ncbi:hypothetical protein XENORESO_018704 [Xenotaenia resolanae]|uniref:Uncharacterized protein n=1 Tax=Xenotaenia resolanae TaxID=208358 RepID=A0ABV0X3A3_9TELE
MSRGLGSLGPWLDVFGPREVLLGGSPGTLSCSSLGGCGGSGDGSPGVPVLWEAFGCLWLRSPPYLSQVQWGWYHAPFGLKKSCLYECFCKCRSKQGVVLYSLRPSFLPPFFSPSLPFTFLPHLSLFRASYFFPFRFCLGVRNNLK